VEVDMFDIKKQLRWSKLRAGLIITIALLLLFFTVFFAGSIDKIFSPTVQVRAAINDVRGLKQGAPVWISGVEVGSVTDITLNPEEGTIVTMAVKRRDLKFVRRDSVASVLTLGLLGDKYIELSPGTPQSPIVHPGELIKGTTPIEIKDVMETGAMSIKKMNDFMEKLGHLVTKIETSKGSLSKFIEDPALYDNLQKASKSLSTIADDINSGRGSMGMLIKDRSLYDRLAETSSSMEAFSRKLAGGSGTLNKLVEDTTLYDRLSGTAASMEAFSSKLNKSSGTISKLMDDPELYDNLNKASKELSLILEKVDKGKGTAGALISDEELAQELKGTIKELKELTADIKENPGRYFKFSLF
jgi:phospholipid/cholesterol/gamma-HCH transport system substrate-binding protein